MWTGALVQKHSKLSHDGLAWEHLHIHTVQADRIDLGRHVARYLEKRAVPFLGGRRRTSICNRDISIRPYWSFVSITGGFSGKDPPWPQLFVPRNSAERERSGLKRCENGSTDFETIFNFN